MKYTINSENKTITIFSDGGDIEEIKAIMNTFKGYTLLTGPKKECICNPKKGGDGICKCE
jgi:hypothetical protein